MIRSFLNTVPQSKGVIPPPVIPRFSVQTDGASFLVGSNAGTRFLFPIIGSGLVTTVATWVRIHSKAGFQKLWQVGDGSAAATVVAGLQYNPGADTFTIFCSTGAVFTSLDTGYHPVIDTWYFLVAGFTENAIGQTSWDTTHQIESSSVGHVQPGYNPIANPRLGIFAAPDGAFQSGVSGIDSFGFWPRASLPGATPLWNNGKALNFNEVPAPFNAGETLWADFNEASGSASYMDSSPVNSPLVASGGGLTRQVGAGY